MHPARRADPSSSASSSGESRLGRWWRDSPLGRDIVVILVVKALVLSALWFAFFRAPAARHMAMDPKAVELQVAGTGTHSKAPNADH
jgi:hypothetical protein